NELDPDSDAVRLLLLGIMLASLLMAVAIPEAFGSRALLFAGSYVAIQVGRHLFLTFVAAGPGTIQRERAGPILIWFAVAAALWWLYFPYVAAIATRRLELSATRTTLARDAYAYLHVVFVAGIIVTAVGQELVIAHPTEELAGRAIVAVVAGPTIYLLAHVLFRLRMTGTTSNKRLTAAVACVAAGALGPFVPGLALALILAAVLIGLIGAEQLTAVRRRTRGEPSPRERLEASAGS